MIMRNRVLITALFACGALLGAASAQGNDSSTDQLGAGDAIPSAPNPPDLPSVAIAAEDVPSVYRGFLVITLQHNPISNHTLVLPSLVNSNQRRITLTLEEKLQYAPPGYTTGTEVSVVGSLVDGTIRVKSWDNITILTASTAGALTTRLTKMKVLYMHLTSQCSPNSDAGAVQKAVEAVQANWVACSHNKFSFDPESEWVVNIDVGCPDDCQGSLERSRNIALDAARAQGLDPNAFAYHYFFWPKWVNDKCWAGIAQIGCYGQDQWACRAEVAEPWSAQQSTIAHELGHTIGNHHAGNGPGFCARTPQYKNNWWPCSDNNEYGDETSNMGSTGWLNAMCFNLPQQHFLGWTNPTVWRNADIPMRTVKAIQLKSLTATPNTGLRVALNNFRALYIDYIRKEGPRESMPDWGAEQVGVYQYGWDGGAFKPGYDDESKTKMVAAVSNGGTLTLGGDGLPKIIIKPISMGDGEACVLLCRYGKKTGECKFGGKTC